MQLLLETLLIEILEFIDESPLLYVNFYHKMFPCCKPIVCTFAPIIFSFSVLFSNSSRKPNGCFTFLFYIPMRRRKWWTLEPHEYNKTGQTNSEFAFSPPFTSSCSRSQLCSSSPIFYKLKPLWITPFYFSH